MGATSILKVCDNFSSSVSFTFKGNGQYKTAFGGAVTLLIYILMLCFFIIIINEPLKVTSSNTTLVEETDTNNGTSGNFTTIESSENYIKIGDVEFIGEYSVKKQTLPYFPTFTYGTPYRPQDDGFMVGAALNANTVNTEDSLFLISYYYVYYDFDISSFAMSYLDTVVCVTEMFPDEILDTLIISHIEGNYLCPDLTDVEIIGDDGYMLAVVEINAQYCVDNSVDCFEEVASRAPEEMILKWSEGYYDTRKPSDPIKHDQLRSYSIAVSTSYAFDIIDIQLNQAKLLNGTIMTFPQLEGVRRNNYGYAGYSQLSVVVFSLSPMFNVYEQYVDYQPYLSNSTRNLESDQNGRELDSESEREAETEDDLMSPLYFVFYICAQLGGFYSFCSLIFAPFVSSVNSKVFLHDIINQAFLLYKSKNTKSSKDKKANQKKSQQRVVPENVPSMQQLRKSIPSSDQDQQENDSSHSSGKQVGYEGGEDRDLLRRRNNEQQNAKRYDNADLLYSIFCCIGNSMKGRRTRSGRLAKFKQEAKSFNNDRDVVQLLDSLNSLRSQIAELENKFLTFEGLVQIEPMSQSFLKTPTINVHPANQKYISSDIGVIEEEKNAMPVSHQNSSLSQILDEIENHKGNHNAKVHAKAINSIVSNELKSSFNHNDEEFYEEGDAA